MLKLIITDRIGTHIKAPSESMVFISMRSINRVERSIARRMGLKPFYLPALSKEDSKEFFLLFDCFWNQVIKPFDRNHPYWRNVISSKMQEWERSAAYFGLMLFTLHKCATQLKSPLVIVCSSLEEEQICIEWARAKGWQFSVQHSHRFTPWWRRLCQETINLKKYFTLCLLCIYHKCFSAKSALEWKPEGRKILICSLVYQNSFHDRGLEHPFFGKLHCKLDEEGYDVTYLSSPLDNVKSIAGKIRRCSEISIIAPLSKINWMKLFYILLSVFLRRIRIQSARFCQIDFSPLLKWNARRFDYYFNLHAEIYYASVDKICQENQIERMILIYEGNVFERACIQAYRENASCVVVGYSHAVVFPLNLKIRLTAKELKNRPEPDYLVSSGNENKRLMVEIGNRKSITIYPGVSLRHIPETKISSRKQMQSNQILLALDGVKSAEKILNWAFENEEILRDCIVKVRSHPNILINSLLSQCIEEIPINFSISTDNLKQDLADSFCVLYRQTSIGLQALSNGIPAIHLNIDAPLVCDPIKNLKSLKWSVSTGYELRLALDQIKNLDPAEIQSNASIARAYAQSYFSPLEKNGVAVFLSTQNGNA